MTTQTRTHWITSKRLMAESGASYRQIQYWTSLGRLHSYSGPSPGSGRRHQYPESEIRVARLLCVAASLNQGTGLRIGEEQLLGWAERIRRGEGGLARVARGLWLDLDEVSR